MLKQEFFDKLRARLSGLPQKELEDRLAFYGEMIDDRMEEGLSEAEAVDGIGSVDSIAEQIIDETPMLEIAKEKMRSKRRLKGWEIAMLIIGAPLWISLVLCLFSILLSIFVAVWSVVVSFWSVFVSLVGCGVGGLVGGIVVAAMGDLWSCGVLIGVALVCVGLAIFSFLGCQVATKGTAWLTKKTCSCIKRCIVGKERA